MNSLFFGITEIPLSTKEQDVHNGIKQINSLKLDALEFLDVKF